MRFWVLGVVVLLVGGCTRANLEATSGVSPSDGSAAPTDGDAQPTDGSATPGDGSSPIDLSKPADGRVRLDGGVRDGDHPLDGAVTREGASATDIYAVGNPGVILHSAGDGTWTPQTSPITTGKFAGAWGSGAGDLYVVGDAGTLHSTGDGKWELYATGSAQLTSISGVPG